jgi:hypothetical protein
VIELPCRSYCIFLYIYTIFEVLTSVQAWNLLQRDNSTQIDAINVMRCLNVNGYPNSTIIAIDEFSKLTLINMNGTSNNNAADKVASKCQDLFGYGLSLGAYKGAELPPAFKELGKLADLSGDLKFLT